MIHTITGFDPMAYGQINTYSFYINLYRYYHEFETVLKFSFFKYFNCIEWKIDESKKSSFFGIYLNGSCANLT